MYMEYARNPEETNRQETIETPVEKYPLFAEIRNREKVLAATVEDLEQWEWECDPKHLSDEVCKILPMSYTTKEYVKNIANKDPQKIDPRERDLLWTLDAFRRNLDRLLNDANLPKIFGAIVEKQRYSVEDPNNRGNYITRTDVVLMIRTSSGDLKYVTLPEENMGKDYHRGKGAYYFSDIICEEAGIPMITEENRITHSRPEHAKIDDALTKAMKDIYNLQKAREKDEEEKKQTANLITRFMDAGL